MIILYENDEIYVRPLTIEDVQKEAYKAWFYDQEVCKYNSHGVFSHGFETEDVLYKEHEKNIIWGVFVKKFYPYGELSGYVQNKHIGNVALWGIDWINRNAEFTCIFGEKAAWGQGSCTEAMKWLFYHGFNKLNLHKIWLGTVQGNEGMEKVALKLGMEQESELLEHVFINGAWKNVVHYAIRNKI